MGCKNGLSISDTASHCGRKDEAAFVLSCLEDEAAHEFLESELVNRTGCREDGLPEWFNEERFKRGVDTFERNIFIMFAGKMSGLLTLLAVPSIVKVLVETRQSGKPQTAFRRYIDTIRHMLFWYRSDITDPKSKGRESIAVVRNHHLRGAAAARRAGLVGISQLDLVLTQFAFCGYAALRRRRLHLDATDQDVLDFLHVWRTIGFLIGVRDRYNVCQFDEGMDATDEVFQGICTRWLAPALATPPLEFGPMSRALLDGVWCMMPVLEYYSYVHFTQELAGVPHNQRQKTPTTYSSIMLTFLHLVPNSLGWPILGSWLRKYHNANMHFSVYMSTFYPLLAWYSFPGSSSTRYQKLVPGER